MNKNDIEQHDDFNPELEEDETGAGKKKLLMLLLAGTLAIGLLLYNLFNDLHLGSHLPPPKNEDTRIEKKSFEHPKPKPKPKLNLEPEPKPLPLLPPKAELPKKTLKPKVIKSMGTTLVKFDNRSTKTGIASSEGNATEMGQSTTGRKKMSPYTGGAYTIAGAHHLDPNLYLPRGTYIGCSLKTRLVSMVTGQIACTVSNDVYSANGNVLLIEKGSEIIGSYKTGKLTDGMDRHFVIWEDIRTPNNVIINVNSGASDELGSAGIHGEVDHHWDIRLGMALMISLIDDSIGALSQRLNDKEVYFAPNTTQQTAEDVTNNLINKFSNIKPTLYKNHGDIVGVFVNRDIDFSKVYDLKRRSRR